MGNAWLFWGLGGMLGAAGIALLYWSLLHDRAHGKRRCPKCWYVMTHAAADDPLRCPECGHRVKTGKMLYKTRRKWRWAVVGMVLASVGYVWGHWPQLMSSGWITLAPNSTIIVMIPGKKDHLFVEELNRRFDERINQGHRPDDIFWDWQWRSLSPRLAESCRNRYRFDSIPPPHAAVLLAKAPVHFSEMCIPTLREGVLESNADKYRVHIITLLRDIADRSGDSRLRSEHIEFLYESIGLTGKWRFDEFILESLGQPWPEAVAAVPFLAEHAMPFKPLENGATGSRRFNDLWEFAAQSLVMIDSYSPTGAIDLVLERLPDSIIMPLMTEYDAIVSPRIHKRLPRPAAANYLFDPEELDVMRVLLFMDPSHPGARDRLALWMEQSSECQLTMRLADLWSAYGFDPDPMYKAVEKCISLRWEFDLFMVKLMGATITSDDRASAFIMDLLETTDHAEVLSTAHDQLRLMTLSDDVIQRMRKQLRSDDDDRRRKARKTLMEIGMVGNDE